MKIYLIRIIIIVIKDTERETDRKKTYNRKNRHTDRKCRQQTEKTENVQREVRIYASLSLYVKTIKLKWISFNWGKISVIAPEKKSLMLAIPFI